MPPGDERRFLNNETKHELLKANYSVLKPELALRAALGDSGHLSVFSLLVSASRDQIGKLRLFFVIEEKVRDKKSEPIRTMPASEVPIDGSYKELITLTLEQANEVWLMYQYLLARLTEFQDELKTDGEWGLELAADQDPAADPDRWVEDEKNKNQIDLNQILQWVESKLKPQIEALLLIFFSGFVKQEEVFTGEGLKKEKEEIVNIFLKLKNEFKTISASIIEKRNLNAKLIYSFSLVKYNTIIL